MTFWHPKTETPDDHGACLVGVNGKILADVFIWMGGRFVGQTSIMVKGVRTAHDFILRPADIHSWAYLSDVESPPA